jgi:hypothetical protein
MMCGSVEPSVRGVQVQPFEFPARILDQLGVCEVVEPSVRSVRVRISEFSARLLAKLGACEVGGALHPQRPGTSV